MVNGFLFAFYLYPERDKTCHERLAHMLTLFCTASDKIHVEMIPVVNGRLDERSYTSYMGRPFGVSSSKRCMSNEHLLLFLPTERVEDGRRLLESLLNVPYTTMLWLPLVALPTAVKRLMGGCAASSGASVFCSQAGMMLVQFLGHNAHVPPSLSSPGDLWDALLAIEGVVPMRRRGDKSLEPDVYG